MGHGVVGALTGRFRSSGSVAIAFLFAASVVVPILTVGPEDATAATTLACPAGAVEWDAAGDGNWNVPGNWDSGAEPTAGQNVCIRAGVTVTVTGTDTAVIDQLVSDGAVTVQSGRTLTIDGESEINGAFSLSGNVAGSGVLRVSAVGVWSSGTVEDGASLVVDAGGVLDITGAVPRVMLGSLVNEAGGTVNHSSIGTVSVSTAAAGPSGEITNRGVWRLTQDNATTTASGATANPGSFVNEAGAILERDRASGASTNSTRFTTGIEVTNHGTITTTNGELTIDAVAAIGDESVVDADAGTVLELTGDDAVVSGASDVTGTGVVELRGRYVMDPGAEIDAATGDGGRSELVGEPGWFGCVAGVGGGGLVVGDG